MGTYTANYQLYMPSIGEQGWGDLMNGNLTTIDTTMKGLNTRMGTAETEIDAVEEKVTALEPLSIIQVDENQNVTFPAGVNIGGIPVNKQGSCTVTPKTSGVWYSTPSEHSVTLLPPSPGLLYSGSLKFKHTYSSNRLFYVETGYPSGSLNTLNINKGVVYTFTFENVPYMSIRGTNDGSYQDFTLS